MIATITEKTAIAKKKKRKSSISAIVDSYCHWKVVSILSLSSLRSLNSFFSAIAAITANVAIIWKPGLRSLVYCTNGQFFWLQNNVDDSNENG